jgi:hypothetical protein
MFLRIGEPVRAAQFARLVNVDPELARHLLPADSEALDVRMTSRLELAVVVTRHVVLPFETH